MITVFTVSCQFAVKKKKKQRRKWPWFMDINSQTCVRACDCVFFVFQCLFASAQCFSCYG